MHGAVAAAVHARAPGRVRLIGGAWKRTPLAVAPVPGLRPTPDRVRVTLFDWIAHLRADLGSLRALDLFAGTGALGLELASRGAREVVLVERDPRALAVLRTVVERLQAADRVRIEAGDALALAAHWPAAGFDVVFVDPPYAGGLHQPALRAAARLARPGALVVIETPAGLPESWIADAGLQRLRSGRAGQVHFELLLVGGC